MSREIGALAAGLTRYSLAAIGPIGGAAAQFGLAFVLLRVLDQAAYGRFSFLLITSQFSLGIWSALLCAPLPVLLSRCPAGAREPLLRCLLSVNLIGTVAAFPGFLVLGIWLHQPLPAACLFGAYASMSLLRWFARAQAYAVGHTSRTITSDIVYASVLALSIGLFAFHPADPLAIGCGALLWSSILGLLPFGSAFLKNTVIGFSPANLPSYRAVWRQHASWSTLGVITTEATANAHAYLVTLLLGPTAFAPIAASTLIIRPITVAMNALTEYERAQMARQLAAGRTDLALRAARLFRATLIGLWVMSAVAIVLVAHYKPTLLFPPRYNLGFLLTASGLWMLVAAARLSRTPDSALLQAAGIFRPLAQASVWTSGISVTTVLLILYFAGPLWSIIGVLLGEIVFAILILRLAREHVSRPDRRPCRYPPS